MLDNRILQQKLEQELALLEELNSLSLLKKDALLKDDLDALETIVLKEEALSAKLRTINDACLPQVQFFLTGQNKNEEVLNLTKSLKKKVLQLKQNNELNQALLKDSLSIIQFSINCFSTQAGAQAGVYGSSGKILHSSKRIVKMDKKG